MANFIDDANKKALEIMQNAQPTLVGMGVAKDVVPGMHKKLIMHAGPPITWEKMSGPLRGAVIGGLIYEGLQRLRRRRKNSPLLARLNSTLVTIIRQWGRWQVL